MSIDLDSYVDVASRVVEFRTKHPEGSLQPVDLAQPYRVQTIGDQTFIVYTAAAYRTPDDQRPGVGIAWEQFPGRTPYTRGSELQNAETSAWGRAIVAVLAADTRRGVASQDEVRNRSAERDQPAEAKPQGRAKPAQAAAPKDTPESRKRSEIAAHANGAGIPLDTIADSFQAKYRKPIAEGALAQLDEFLSELQHEAAYDAAADQEPNDGALAYEGVQA